MPVLEEKPRISVPGNQGITIHRSITVALPVQDCFRFWSDFENFPKFMKHLVSVTRVSDKVSHWVAKGPVGRVVEWDAEIINLHPDNLIAWRTVSHPDVAHAGSVRFKPTADGGTEISVALEYLPPAGRLGAWAAKLAGEDPERQIDEDLREFKNLVESGKAKE